MAAVTCDHVLIHTDDSTTVTRWCDTENQSRVIEAEFRLSADLLSIASILQPGNVLGDWKVAAHLRKHSPSLRELAILRAAEIHGAQDFGTDILRARRRLLEWGGLITTERQGESNVYAVKLTRLGLAALGK